MTDIERDEIPPWMATIQKAVERHLKPDGFQSVSIRTGEASTACLMMLGMLLALSKSTSTTEQTDAICAAAAQGLARMIRDAREILAAGASPFPQICAFPDPDDEDTGATLH